MSLVSPARYLIDVEITGPVADAPRAPSTSRGGCIASCLSGCGTAFAALVVFAVTGLAFTYELAQPGHRARGSVPDGTCEMVWWRSASGSGKYRLTCTAKKDLTVEKIKLLSGPSGVELVESTEDWGQRPWEDQRPLSNETILIEGGERWRYDGTISLGPIPYVGPPATVTMWADVDGERLVFRADEGR